MKKLIFTFALVAGLSGLGFVNASYAANCSTGTETDNVSTQSSSGGGATKSPEENKNNRVSTPGDEG